MITYWKPNENPVVLAGAADVESSFLSAEDRPKLNPVVAAGVAAAPVRPALPCGRPKLNPPAPPGDPPLSGVFPAPTPKLKAEDLGGDAVSAVLATVEPKLNPAPVGAGAAGVVFSAAGSLSFVPPEGAEAGPKRRSILAR